MTPENLRYHAAGHIAAAALLAEAGKTDAARTIMATVNQFVSDPKVQAPPQVKNKVFDTTVKPDASELALLEKWFVDPLNTTIEKNGGNT